MSERSNPVIDEWNGKRGGFFYVESSLHFRLEMEVGFHFYVYAGSQMAHELETGRETNAYVGLRIRFHLATAVHIYV